MSKIQKKSLKKTFERESQLKCFNYSIGINFLLNCMVSKTLAICFPFFKKNSKKQFPKFVLATI
jgi:hypothetical protein